MTQPKKTNILWRDKRRTDRRKKVDPRYRNADYLEFVDRRASQDRRCQTECQPPPTIVQYLKKRQGIMVLGGVAGALFLYLFALCAFNVLDLPSLTDRQPRKASPMVTF
ncbi:MAG: hypothetical protein V1742_04020 [Pseudomonadota bacterium]